jgi:hypothetical protein
MASLRYTRRVLSSSYVASPTEKDVDLLLLLFTSTTTTIPDNNPRVLAMAKEVLFNYAALIHSSFNLIERL